MSSYTPSPTILLTTLVLLAVTSLLTMGLFSRRRVEKFDPADKHCYIGGASEGLGLSLACQLAARGAHVSIVSRSEHKLALALAEIEKHRISPTQKFASYSCDLTSSSASSATFTSACAPFAGAAPAYIFACAGGTIPGMFVDLTAEEHWKGMEWNFRTALNTVYEGVKAMKESERGAKQGERRIVLTASVLAMFGFAGYSAYTPSKYAIRGLAETLRNELLLYNISVHLFLPATIFSPGFEHEQSLKPALTKKIEGPDEGKSCDDVAAALIRGLERDEFAITYEPVGHMLRNSAAVVPGNNRLFDAFWGLIGTIGLPIWRMTAMDGEVHKEVKAQATAAKNA